MPYHGSPLKTYQGNRDEHTVRVLTIGEGRTATNGREIHYPVTYTSLSNPFARGFAWGHGVGPGPNGLACALLTDYLGYKPSGALWIPFKWAVVAPLPGSADFALPATAIQSWLDTCRIPESEWPAERRKGEADTPPEGPRLHT